MTIRNSDPNDPEQSFDIELTKPQYRLVTTNKRFPAFVAGFGSGKTAALIERAILLKFKYPTLNVGYYLPTFGLVRKIAFPRFTERLTAMGFKAGTDFRVIKSPDAKIVIKGYGEIIFGSMDTPELIIGYEHADALLDELDTLTPANASVIWKKIIARNRQKKPDGAKNTMAVGTTPEGFRFVYEQWKKKPPNEQYELIQASTYSNRYNLPADYIQDLLDAYPSNLIAAYIEGEFTNLTSGSVYAEYNRVLNRSNETIKRPVFNVDGSIYSQGEALHIGLDFNVTKMAAVIHVKRDGFPHAVGELVDMFDTPAAIATIKSKFPNHQIFVYPDASGGARKSINASVSDIALLEAAKFIVCNNESNPAVKDRINAMNGLICAGPLKVRRYKVNDTLCPVYAEALEKQAYDKNGEPDKSSGFDHIVDAGGYFVCYCFPIVGRGMSLATVKGN